jgi:integrase
MSGIGYRALSQAASRREAFFACLYYAALRPSEAVMLRESDLHLPKKGWGRIDLAASASRAGTAWTDHGTARQERGRPPPLRPQRQLRALGRTAPSN